MEKLYITSLQNPLVKAWRALKDAKARAEQGLFLAEGDHLTGEALTAHAAAALLIAEQEQARYQRHLDAAQGQNLSVYVLSDRAMGAVCDAKTPQGVATLCRLPQLHQPLPADKLKIAALDGKPFFERVRTHPGVCVIIGNEGAGISNAVYAVPGIQRVKLPMAGGAESLNASVAGAIMVYDIVRLGK